MTSQLTFLLLVSLSTPSWQQGQQYFFNGNGQRFFNNFQQPPFPNYFQTQHPQRTVEFRSENQFAPDLKTSDVSLEYQQQLPQYQQFQRQPFGGSATFERGFVPIQQPQSSTSTAFQDFNHFHAQNTFSQDKNYVIQQPVTSRPSFFIDQFGIHQSALQNNIPLDARGQSRGSSRKENSKPTSIGVGGRFPAVQQEHLPTNVLDGIEVVQSKEITSNHVKTDLRKPDVVPQFGIRGNKITAAAPFPSTRSPVRSERTKSTVEIPKEAFSRGESIRPQFDDDFPVRNRLPAPRTTSVTPLKQETLARETTTVKLKVPFEDEVTPIKAIKKIELKEEKKDESGSDRESLKNGHSNGQFPETTHAVRDFLNLVSQPFGVPTTPPLKPSTTETQKEVAEPEEDYTEEEYETEEVNEDYEEYSEPEEEEEEDEMEQISKEKESEEQKVSDQEEERKDLKNNKKEHKDNREHELHHHHHHNHHHHVKDYKSDERRKEVSKDQKLNVAEKEEEERLNDHTTVTLSSDKEQLASPKGTSEPTESWVIVASVQTSRSVSGARFLPSGIVNQKERNETLNDTKSEDLGRRRPFLPKSGSKRTSTTTTASTTTTTTTTSNSVETTTLTSTTSSTESILDKLDRVQSELSSAIFSGNFPKQSEVLTMPDVTPGESLTTKKSTVITNTTIKPAPSFTTEEDSEDSTPFLIRRFSPSAKRTTTTAKPSKKISSLLDSLQFDDLTGLLPVGFKARGQFTKKNTTETNKTTEKPEPSTTTRKINFKPKFARNKTETVRTSSPQPSQTTASLTTSLADLGKIKFQEDISSFLPSDYKAKTENIPKPKVLVTTMTTTAKPKGLQSFLGKIKFQDQRIPTDLLPFGFNQSKIQGDEKPTSASAPKEKGIDDLLSKVKQVDVNAFLPPGFALNTTVAPTVKMTAAADTHKGPVFPTRAGGVTRKPFGHQTTEKPTVVLLPEIPKIQKGWPIRATTAFTGWPTSSTTPVSLEKLIEQAKQATSETTASETTSTTSTTTTTTTTTTPKPTTPGICSEDCELAGTVKLVGGVEWIPELLDRNTKEWQDLANEVETELDQVYRNSEELSQWYKGIRIDSFSKGSVLVDYFVELETGEEINTQEMKKLFHESLSETIVETEQERSQKSLDLEGNRTNNDERGGKMLKLGKFSVDPKFTDFVVVQKQSYPSVGYAEEDAFLPQWAIAVIVIGLASLLFVIIFGVTVLVNRHKNNKKKTPTPLTEDIINEMNKHHLGGFDNYGADDLYGMDDVWNDRAYDKPPKKRSHSSYADNSMTNLYDSWRSDWNGYYYNSYYGGSGGGSGYGIAGGRRRSDYDTNF